MNKKDFISIAPHRRMKPKRKFADGGVARFAVGGVVDPLDDEYRRARNRQVAYGYDPVGAYMYPLDTAQQAAPLPIPDRSSAVPMSPTLDQPAPAPTPVAAGPAITAAGPATPVAIDTSGLGAAPTGGAAPTDARPPAARTADTGATAANASNFDWRKVARAAKQGMVEGGTPVAALGATAGNILGQYVAGRRRRASPDANVVTSPRATMQRRGTDVEQYDPDLAGGAKGGRVDMDGRNTWRGRRPMGPGVGSLSAGPVAVAPPPAAPVPVVPASAIPAVPPQPAVPPGALPPGGVPPPAMGPVGPPPGPPLGMPPGPPPGVMPPGALPPGGGMPPPAMGIGPGPANAQMAAAGAVPPPPDPRVQAAMMAQMQAQGAPRFKKGGAVAVEDTEGDSPKAKRSRERQWGDIGKPAEELPPEKKARGGAIKRRRPLGGRKDGQRMPVPMVTDDDMGPPPAAGLPAPSPAVAPPPMGMAHGGQCADGKMAKGGKWIQSAISKPGALHTQLGVPQGEKIPAAKLAKAAEAGGKLGQRARLAQTLKGFGKAEGGEVEEEDKMAAGGVAKLRRGYPNTNAKPKKMATGGTVRGCGIATKGKGFSGIY